MHHGVQNTCTRILLYITVPILVLLYLNDVSTMMSYYWGAPAFNMTQNTNKNEFCLYTNNGFVNVIAISYLVSQFTPVIWSIVIGIGFLSMLGGERKNNKFHHEEQTE